MSSALWLTYPLGAVSRAGLVQKLARTSPWGPAHTFLAQAKVDSTSKGRTAILGVLYPAIGSLMLLLWLHSSNLETKWVVYILSALCSGALILLSGNVKKSLFTVLALGLQMNVNWYIGDAANWASRWSGSSGPMGIIIPFVTIPAAALVLLQWLRWSETSSWRFSWGKEIAYAAMLVFATSAMTVIYTPERALAIYYLIEQLELYIIFLAVINTLKTPKDVAFAVNLLMANLVLQSVIYFIQNLLGVTFTLVGEVIVRSDSLQRNGGTVSVVPAQFASFMLPLLLIAVSRFLSIKSMCVSLWMGFFSVMGVAALVLTYTRAAWGGFILGILWIIAVNVKRGSISQLRLFSFVVIFILVIVVFLPEIILRISADNVSDYDERVALWRMALNVIQHHPLLGVGAGAYGHVFQQYLTSILAERWLYIVHNVYLLRWAETGIFGLISFIGLFLLGFYQAYRCSSVQDEFVSSLALGWSAGLISLMWEMFWDVKLGFQCNALIWFMLGLIFLIKRFVFANSSDAI